MASLKEVKTRIASVENTRKITQVQHMISSAHLHRAEVAFKHAREYREALEAMLGDVSHGVEGIPSPLIAVKDSPNRKDADWTEQEWNDWGRPGWSDEDWGDKGFGASADVGKDTGAGVDPGAGLGIAAGADERKRRAAKRKGLEAPVAIVMISSNGGMAGAFNSRMIKQLDDIKRRYHDGGAVIYPIGKKIREAAERAGFETGGNYDELMARPDSKGAAVLARELTDKFTHGEISRLDIIYYYYRSITVQRVVRRTLLPYDTAARIMDVEKNGEPVVQAAASVASSVSTARGTGGAGNSGGTSTGNPANNPTDDPAADYIFEPSAAGIAAQLVPMVVNAIFFAAIAETQTAEHAARMTAMQLASDNADRILDELHMSYNKIRQENITTELLDIIGGSFA